MKEKYKWHISKHFTIFRDTIFTGNFTKEAKIHTIENAIRLLSVFALMFLNKSYFVLLFIITVGIHDIKVTKDKYYFKLW